MATTKSLSGEEWLQVLCRLAERLDPASPARIVVIGGAAVALGYGSRRSTLDMDAVLEPQQAATLLRLADEIAPEFGLSHGWLNEKAKEAGFVVDSVVQGPTLFDHPALKVVAPSLEQLAAMKLAAIRGQTDVDDALHLLRRLRSNTRDAEEVWSLTGGLVPVAERPKARYNLLKLWEMLDESA